MQLADTLFVLEPGQNSPVNTNLTSWFAESLGGVLRTMGGRRGVQPSAPGTSSQALASPTDPLTVLKL